MVYVKLSERCGVCNSNIWCGRLCGMAPDKKPDKKAVEKVPDLPTGPDDYLGWAVEASKEDRLALGRKLVEGIMSIKPEDTPFATGSEKEPDLRVSSTYRYRDAEKRRAYQREYQRAYRRRKK